MRNFNVIWDIVDQSGNKVSSQNGLEEVALAHFGSLFQDLSLNNIASQMQVIQYFLS